MREHVNTGVKNLVDKTVVEQINTNTAAAGDIDK